MRYIAAAISLLVTFFLKAQENYPDDRLPVFKQVTHPFMPSITSEYFFFSEDGLLWFSTAQGLTSFDGSEVTYYSSLQQALGFGFTRIFGMAEDNSHNLYLGTQVGLFYYNREKKLFTNLPYSFSDNHKRSDIAFGALYYDHNGILYAGSVLNGLFIYDEHSKQFSHYNLDPTKPDSWEDRRLNTVCSFAKQPADSNKLWIGTFHGIYQFDEINRSFYQHFEITNPVKYLTTSAATGADTSVFPEHYDIEKMDVADDSTIWFNCWTCGFGKYNTNTGQVKLFLQSARLKTPGRNIGYIITRFARLSPGKYLLGIYDGKTAIFDTRTETATYFNVSENDYPEEQTRFVANDRKGNSWLLQKGSLYATIPQNLQLHPQEVPNLTKTNFSNPKLRGIYFDTGSRLFYGAFTGSTGIHVYDTNFILQTIVPTSIINNYYNYNSTIDVRIAKDGSGRFWTVGWKDHVLLPGEKKFELLGKKLPALASLETKGEFNDIVSTRDGNILIKNKGGIIFHIDHLSLKVDTIRCPLIKDEGIEIKPASAWYDNKRNFVYLTRDNGIAQYSLEKRQYKIIPHASLFGDLSTGQGVCAPTLDATGRIWLVIPKYGIRIIDPQSFACIDSIPYGSRGLMRGDYTSITGGPANYILFRSQNGIVVYDFAKQQSFLFDHSNGLSSPDNIAILYCNGYMIISQSGRFEYFKLSGLDNYSSRVIPYLNSIVADTANVFARTGLGNEQNIKLLHDQNTLSFSFSAPEFFFPERIEYAYQFSPVDNDWHYTNYFNRKIIYTKLPPGRYTFRLKAQMQGGNWDIKPVEYTIIITPAWWQTGWFRLLCIIIAAALLIYFIQKRIQQIRKTEQQRSKHEKELLELEAKALRAQMNPHFIFNCMNSIKSLIQQHEEEKAVTYLTTFSKLIRTLFNNADKKEISLYDEIETCKFYLQLEALRFDTKFSFGVNVDDAIDLKSIQVPALIIQPFIENAIWHGIVPRNNGGRVLLNVARKNEFIMVVIDDDGIGRESSRQNKPTSGLAHQSKGVNLTQSRLELNNLLQQRQAELEIIDKKAENRTATGTTVIIKIKEELS